MTASSRRRYHRATPPGRIPVVHAFRRSSVVERAAVNRLVVGSSPTAGATFTLSSATRGRFRPLWPAQIGARVTLSVTLSRDGLLQHVNGLALLGRADVAVDLHGRLAGRVP